MSFVETRSHCNTMALDQYHLQGFHVPENNDYLRTCICLMLHRQSKGLSRVALQNYFACLQCKLQSTKYIGSVTSGSTASKGSAIVISIRFTPGRPCSHLLQNSHSPHCRTVIDHHEAQLQEKLMCLASTWGH